MTQDTNEFQQINATIDDQFTAMMRTTMAEPKHRIYNYKYAKKKEINFKRIEFYHGA